MILFRCSCGHGVAADLRQAGERVRCGGCNRVAPVPAQSDPQMALVWPSGGPDNGVPMLWDDVERQLENGALTLTDLVWSENTCLPLATVVETLRERGVEWSSTQPAAPPPEVEPHP